MCFKFNSLQHSGLRFFDRQKIDLATVNLSLSDDVKSHLILHMFVVSTYVNVVYYQISIRHIGRYGFLYFLPDPGLTTNLSTRKPISTYAFFPVCLQQTSLGKFVRRSWVRASLFVLSIIVESDIAGPKRGQSTRRPYFCSPKQIKRFFKAYHFNRKKR